jgi:hypothetical protein
MIITFIFTDFVGPNGLVFNIDVRLFTTWASLFVFTIGAGGVGGGGGFIKQQQNKRINNEGCVLVITCCC